MIRLAAVSTAVFCCQSAEAQTCAEFAAFVAGEGTPVVADRFPVCSKSKVLGGGQSTDCHWMFDYRAGAARESFRAMIADLAVCVDGDLTKEAKGVNHPDSFDQVTGQLGGLPVSLSLKDKGGVGQTLIFLRVATRVE